VLCTTNKDIAAWSKLNAIFSAQEVEQDIVHGIDCDEEQAIVDRNIAMMQDVDVHISLSVLQEIEGDNTLQLKGSMKKQKGVY